MRQPTPWFRAAKNAWFVELGGRQRRLGRHPDGAAPHQGRLERPARDPGRVPRPHGRQAAARGRARPAPGRQALRPVPRPQPEAPRGEHLRRLQVLPEVVLRAARPPAGGRRHPVPRHLVGRLQAHVEGVTAERRAGGEAGVLLGRPAGAAHPVPAEGARGRPAEPPQPRPLPATSRRRSWPPSATGRSASSSPPCSPPAAARPKSPG